MSSFTKKQIALITLALSLLLWLTRGQHMASLAHLPDASWAIFFALGFYFSSPLFFVAFLGQSVLIDFMVMPQIGGLSIINPGYALLLPAYFVMWLSGRWLAKNSPANNFSTFTQLLKAVVIGVVICEFISSAGFYFFISANTGDLTGFIQNLGQFLLNDLLITVAYIALFAAIHSAFLGYEQKKLALKKV
jgi:hypothetical protein